MSKKAVEGEEKQKDADLMFLFTKILAEGAKLRGEDVETDNQFKLKLDSASVIPNLQNDFPKVLVKYGNFQIDQRHKGIFQHFISGPAVY